MITSIITLLGKKIGRVIIKLLNKNFTPLPLALTNIVAYNDYSF